MWLVLCDPNDVSALWAYSSLRASVPLTLITSDELVFCTAWEHRLGRRATTVKFRLEGGLAVDGASVHGVLNRLYTAPTPHWRSANSADRDYVQQESIAFYLSWLHGLPCPVLNRPTPQGLCGQWRHESEWASLAHRAGLPTPRYRHTTSDRIDEYNGERRLAPPGSAIHTVIVIADALTGAVVPPPLADGCRRLARLAATDILGIDFIADSSGAWLCAGANPSPDLRLGGDRLLAVLFEHLHCERPAAWA